MEQIKQKLRRQFLFLRAMLKDPSSIGAAFPSSDRLAKAIASKVPSGGYVLELGPGTGSITKGLLQNGIIADKLVAIERSRDLTYHLHKTFPDIQLIHGDATELTQLITKDLQPLMAVVSSLPLRSMPKNVVTEIGKQLEQVMQPETQFIQFTYSLFNEPDYSFLSPRLERVDAQHVWLNIPPARVDVFRLKD